jgi:hypothetical protein
VQAYHNLVFHSGVSVGRSRSGSNRSGSSGLVVIGADKVIRHLGVELFSSLLGRAGVAAATLLVSVRSGSLGTAGLGGSRVLLLASGRLGLGLGLTAESQLMSNTLKKEEKRGGGTNVVRSARDLIGGMTLSA